MNARREVNTADLFTILKSRGGRVTKARKEIISALEQSHEPISIQSIAQQVSADGASVYRTMALLQSLNLIEEIVISGGVSKYALIHEHHHHIMCTTCSHVVHIPCTRQSFTAQPIHKDFVAIQEHSVTYYGTCTKCVV